MFNFDIMDMLYSLPAVFIGFSFHEFAHAYTAYLLGDNTAKYEGRLTLDPLSHLDPMGFLTLVLFKFGWAKPVPVNPLNFKNRKTGMILVSLAGPLMNFFLATFALFIYTFLSYKIGYINTIVENIIINIYYINVGLGVFNLIPLPPLDGSKILAGLLPQKQEFLFYRFEQYSNIILLLLIFTNVLNIILKPMFGFAHLAINNIVNIFF